MLRRNGQTSDSHRDPRAGEEVDELLKNIRSGVEALRDPEVERRVREYFEQNPNYSRDMIHVAAIAVSFHSAKANAAGLCPDKEAKDGVKPGI